MDILISIYTGLGRTDLDNGLNIRATNTTEQQGRGYTKIDNSKVFDQGDCLASGRLEMKDDSMKMGGVSSDSSKTLLRKEEIKDKILATSQMLDKELCVSCSMPKPCVHNKKRVMVSQSNFSLQSLENSKVELGNHPTMQEDPSCLHKNCKALSTGGDVCVKEKIKETDMEEEYCHLFSSEHEMPRHCNEKEVKRRRTKRKGSGLSKVECIKAIPTTPIERVLFHKTGAPSSKYARKLVLCSSSLIQSQKEHLTEFALLSGAKLVKFWTSNVTHLLIGTNELGAARRTFKFLMAIAEGKWILNFEWLNHCLLKRKKVTEEPYEVSRDIYGTTGGPKLGRLMVHKLFWKISFYFFGYFDVATRNSLKMLICAAGGITLRRRPVKLEVETLEKSIILYQAGDGNKGSLQPSFEEAEALAISSGALLVSHTWILDAIASSTVQDFKRLIK